MKKTIALRAATLAACIALTCTACGGGSSQPSSQPTVDLSPATSAGSEGGQATPQEKPAQPAPQASQGCALAEQVNNDIPKTAPPVDQWVGVQGVGVPVSSVYGPEKREGDIFTCYQHSPTGALFAAAYVVPATTVKGFADEWTIADSKINKEMKKAEAAGIPPSFSNFRTTGYQFNYYTPEEASINISIEGNTPGGAGNFNVLVTLK
ncbi:hypothetical protein ACUIAL_08800 [Dermabacteraceae bacterium P13136]